MSGTLWRDHLGTPRQQSLPFRWPRQSEHGTRRVTQADVLLAMLREAHAGGRAVYLPEIMAVGIACHGARFSELRSRGFVIHNETERSGDGRVLSRYWLRYDPEQVPSSVVPTESSPLESESQSSEEASQPFLELGDVIVQRRDRDDG
jgi:hypothetical protein